jgi:hypothetical protein
MFISTRSSPEHKTIKIANWAPILETPVEINYDMEKYPLEIKTDSDVKSRERLSVHFRTTDNKNAGGFELFFSSSTIRYSA